MARDAGEREQGRDADILHRVAVGEAFEVPERRAIRRYHKREGERRDRAQLRIRGRERRHPHS